MRFPNLILMACLMFTIAACTTADHSIGSAEQASGITIGSPSSPPITPYDGVDLGRPRDMVADIMPVTTPQNPPDLRARFDEPCIKDTDCFSALCNGGMCAAPPHCSNGVRDADESFTDCGGLTCQKCSEGAYCTVNEDCLLGVCYPVMRAWGVSFCRAQCANGVIDAPFNPWDANFSYNETDVDCGGYYCNHCTDGKRCLANSDCQSGACRGGRCLGGNPTCSDGVKNGNETDLDCGGNCSMPGMRVPNTNGTWQVVSKRCDLGQTCQVDGDCEPGNVDAFCYRGTCQPSAAACRDGVKDGYETDVDCGGPGWYRQKACKPCGVGRVCSSEWDCDRDNHFICVNRACALDACFNGVKDGNESDVDCGGSCFNRLQCAAGKHCWLDRECQSNRCVSGVCANSTCENGVKDGDETDLNCGGAVCPRCRAFWACHVAADCLTNSCTGGLCDADPNISICADGLHNYDETDLDCGGIKCAPCAGGRACLANTDCANGSCSGGRCGPWIQLQNGMGHTIRTWLYANNMNAGTRVMAPGSTQTMIADGGIQLVAYERFDGGIGSDADGTEVGCLDDRVQASYSPVAIAVGGLPTWACRYK